MANRHRYTSTPWNDPIPFESHLCRGHLAFTGWAQCDWFPFSPRCCRSNMEPCRHQLKISSRAKHDWATARGRRYRRICTFTHTNDAVSIINNNGLFYHSGERTWDPCKLQALCELFLQPEIKGGGGTDVKSGVLARHAKAAPVSILDNHGCEGGRERDKISNIPIPGCFWFIQIIPPPLNLNTI